MPRRNLSSNGNGTHPPNQEDASALTQQESVAAFMERDPESYSRIVDFLEQGLSPGGAAALTRVPLALVRKIRNLLGPDALHAAIRQTGRNLIESGQLLSERLANEAYQIPIENVHSALSVVIDKSQLLVGAPTMRVEHKSVPSPEDVMKMFESLPKIEVTSVEGTKESPEPPAPPQRAQIKGRHTAVPAPRSDIP